MIGLVNIAIFFQASYSVWLKDENNPTITGLSTQAPR